MLAAQPATAAPTRDAHLAAMAARLFPRMSAQGGGIFARRDQATARMLIQRRERFDRCKDVAACVVAAAIWQDGERDALARSAPDVAGDDVRREIDGLNEVLRVYGVGKLPRYPLIDGSDEPFGSPAFAAKVADAVTLSQAEQDDATVAGDRSVGLALALLDVNDKDAAIAFDPLDERYNAAALAKARTLDWRQYRYTAIITLGIGPDDLTTPLSPKGKLNVRLAAERFAQGLAPFIIVTGAAVHPRDTPHVEAVEMRRALIERFGVPADAVVIEPYARHTTTNLRNATRRLIALGAPLGRDALVVTNETHSRSIEAPDFAARNQRELGYQPGEIGGRVSPHDLSFRPSRVSLRVDPADPLDP